MLFLMIGETKVGIHRMNDRIDILCVIFAKVKVGCRGCVRSVLQSLSCCIHFLRLFSRYFSCYTEARYYFSQNLKLLEDTLIMRMNTARSYPRTREIQSAGICLGLGLTSTIF